MALAAQREPFALSLSKGRRVAAEYVLAQLARGCADDDGHSANGAWAR